MNPLPVLRKLDEVVKAAQLKKLQDAIEQAPQSDRSHAASVAIKAADEGK